MITRAKAYKLRELILKISKHLDDSDALQGIELFPKWKADGSYEVGDRVSFEGTLYKCLQNHDSQDTWNPSDSPSLWVRVDDPSVEYPEWVQPLGSTDAYRLGDKVSHNGKHWISTIDYNTYEPSVYGWDEV